VDDDKCALWPGGLRAIRRGEPVDARSARGETREPLRDLDRRSG